MEEQSYLYFGKSGPFSLYSRGFLDGVNLAGFGSPGTGKTAGVIVPNLIRWPGTAFVIDISGDISKAVPDTGRVLYAPWTEGNEVTWDVLAAVDAAPKDEREKLLEKLAFAIIKQKNTTSDAGEHYQTESRDLLKALLCAYYLLGLDFVPLCQQIATADMEDLLEVCQFSTSPTAQALARSLEGTYNMKDKLRDAQKAVTVFAEDGPVPRSIRRGGIRPEMIEKQSIYFLIPDTELEAAAQLLQVVTSQMWGYLAARPLDRKNKVLLCLDEFASLGALPIRDALQKFRKRHTSVMYFMQSIASLSKLYEEKGARELLGATQYMVVLDSQDGIDQKYFSDKAGQYIVKTKSETRKHSAADGENQERLWSETQVERKECRIAPDEFAKLPDLGKFALFHPGGVALVRKHFYYKDRRYKRLAARMATPKRTYGAVQSFGEWQQESRQQRELDTYTRELGYMRDLPDGHPARGRLIPVWEKEIARIQGFKVV